MQNKSDSLLHNSNNVLTKLFHNHQKKKKSTFLKIHSPTYYWCMYAYRFCHCTNNYMSKLMKEMDDDCNVSCSAVENGPKEMCQTHFKIFKTHSSSKIGNWYT